MTDLDENLIVICYFVSGKEIEMEMSKKRYEELIKMLSNSWNASVTSNHSISINFGHVTHLCVKYDKVNEEKKRRWF
jgi:hypothetical protein